MTTNQDIPTVSAVARALVELAQNDRDIDQEPMTNMRLQKLLYYVQGWSLARLGRRAFVERIEAWNHGPVVPPLYGKLKDLGRDPVPSERLVGGDDLDDDLRAFVACVWQDYRTQSAIALRRRTHSESPWKDAWNKRKQPDRCTEEITEDALREFFAACAPKGVKGFKKSPPPIAWLDEPNPFIAIGG